MIQGIKICQGAPSVPHLLFADDSLILRKANNENASCLKNILALYMRSVLGKKQIKRSRPSPLVKILAWIIG